MRTKRFIQAAKLALVFLFVGCSSSGDGSTGQTAAAELGVGGGGWSSSDHGGQGGIAGPTGLGGATAPTTEHPGSTPGSTGAGNAGAHDPGAGGKSGSPCSFFGSIFKCPGKSSTPTPGGSTGSGGHSGSGGRSGKGTPETGGGASGGTAGGGVIPRVL